MFASTRSFKMFKIAFLKTWYLHIGPFALVPTIENNNYENFNFRKNKYNTQTNWTITRISNKLQINYFVVRNTLFLCAWKKSTQIILRFHSFLLLFEEACFCRKMNFLMNFCRAPTDEWHLICSHFLVGGTNFIYWNLVDFSSKFCKYWTD